MFRSLLIVTVVLCTASPAAAQIYSWRDADGKLVLSDRPRPDQGIQKVATYAVHGATTVRATKPFSTSAKSAPYEAAISEHARREGVAADLVRAVIQVESAFNPRAVSEKGAMGLMQLMPATARDLGVKDPFDPEQNIRGGVAYLKQLLTRYNQKVELALAAYNAGMGNVEKYGGTVPPFKETRNYVNKITKAAPTSVQKVNGMYKWVELVDGKPVTKYSNMPPPQGSFTLVGLR
ncbi:MAG TPA: lytic transglycosylase domain-containing protein [Vicinamibacterales bacterium]|nr:lytic transglycosylase domain-containing protein [Vicinamibacterales bacterium]